jgi:hypothetical protein
MCSTEQNTIQNDHNKKPDLYDMHEWGTDVQVKVDERDKLSP